MANVKSAGVREMVIDRCLQDRRGYTIEKLMELVNEALLIDGLRPVTSGNTIRNDIDNIANRWKQAVRREKRGHAIYFSYQDPSFSIFKCQLTNAELRVFYSALINLKYLDVYIGSAVFPELSKKLEEQLHIDCYQLPILLFENCPSGEELEHFRKLYLCILSRTVVKVTYQQNKDGPFQHVIHPYFMRQKQQQWHLLGYNETVANTVCLPIRCILFIEEDKKAVFIPNTTINIHEYYTSLHETDTLWKI